MVVRRLSLGILLVALAAFPALAENEKVFRLKNGWKVEGELLEETPTSYVVKTAGGKSVLQKRTVASVEDPPPPPKPFLEPEPKKEEPPPPDEDAPLPPSSQPATPDTPAPAAPTPAPSASSPLASDAEIAAMRKALLAVPVPTDADSAAARNKAIEDIAKTGSMPALVAIVSEPEAAQYAKVPPERALALQILQSIDAVRVRPLLAQAVSAVDLKKGVPRQLLQAINAASDSDDGAIAQALIAKSADEAAAGNNPEPLLAPLEWLGKRPMLPGLYKLLLTPDKANAADAWGKACYQIASHDSDPDAALTPLLALLDPQKLPPYSRLAPALGVLGASRGQAAYPIGRLLEALERTTPSPEDAPAHEKCLKAGYRSLTGILNLEARDRILRGIDDARTPERRILVLDAIAKLSGRPRDLPNDFVVALVERMSAPDRTDSELQAFGAALDLLTGKKIGPDAAGWKIYVSTLH